MRKVFSMSYPKYKPRYTSNGHSIELLKAKAKSIQKKQNCKKREALDIIAQQHSFSNWNEITNQELNPPRDLFYEHFYGDRSRAEFSEEQYTEYLEKNKIEDSSEAFRQYAEKHRQSYEKLGFDNLCYLHSRPDNQVLMQELADQISRKGAVGLLPQQLPSYILEGMMQGYERSKEEPADEEEDTQTKGEGVLMCVLSFIAYESGKPEITVPTEELMENCETFYLRLKLEWISRKTEMHFEKPTLKNILSPDESITMNINSKVWEDD